MKCVCGSTEFTKSVRKAVNVDQTGTSVPANLHLATCKRCGVIRQIKLPFDDEEGFVSYYRKYPPTMDDYSAKDYSHDLGLAEKRCNSYGIVPGFSGEVLDIGSGSGAFIEEARNRGADAWGCEIGRYHYAGDIDRDCVYRKRFEDVLFPTDKFRMVVCHDVLEHVLDPVRFIAEMFRVTAQNGQCMVDFPNYYESGGEHHWKVGEHIWFFKLEQLSVLLKDAGFLIDSVEKPIESKLLFRLRKPVQKRPKILLPPGIGDSYWSVVKLRAFLRREKLGLPDIFVVCPRNKGHEGHKRSFPFLDMFPFVHSTGVSIEGRTGKLRPIWMEAYMRPGRTVFRNVAGFDYFISYNGHLRVGESLEEVDPDLECEWFPPMFVSLNQENFIQDCQNRIGKYIVFYLPFQGSYRFWIKEFPVSEIIVSIREICRRTGCVPVMTGAKWDAENRTLRHVMESIPGCVDMTGRTTVEEMFGLLRGSQAVIGFPSGLTIMSTVLGCKTMIIWNDYYNRRFFMRACPPSTWEKSYFAENTKGLTTDYLVGWAVEKIDGVGNKVVRNEFHTQKKYADLADDAKPENLFVPKSVMNTNEVRKKFNSGVTVACVLKGGGDFDQSYVANLRAMMERNSTITFKFVCLTDQEVDDCDTIPLISGFPGWWSKLELFRPDIFDTERIVYLDLDTIIVSNVNRLLDLNGNFYALRPWNVRNRLNGWCASGLMAWANGCCNFLYNDFSGATEVGGDQAYISRKIGEHGISPFFLQDFVPGIYSYKRQCRISLPNDASIVCFHGKPRIHNCSDDWVVANWRG